jgi:hypothetical protein
MSVDRYFDKFPVITYANNQVVDITRRVTLLDKVSKNPYVFYPYDIASNERADQFSSRYYQDSFKSWILYLSNNINDPYYEWYLSEKEFLDFIEMKYGSIFNAQQKIKYYRNNWENQENLSVSGYNALSNGMKKYWNPNYGIGSSILSYSRRDIDWTTTTNKIISYTVANTSFIKDEIVNIYLDGNSLGKGQIAKAVANNLIYVQHVSGFFQESDSLQINSNGYIYGTESNVNTAVTEATTIVSNIEEDELNYWKAYTYYDYELEKNEFNKSIRIIDSNYAETAVNNLTELLGE